MRLLKRIDDGLARLESGLIILFLWLMVLFTFLQVVLRSLYTHGNVSWANTLLGTLDWTDPFVRLLVLWLTFLGASLLTREKRHIKIDFLTPLLPPRWRFLREAVLSAVCVLLCAIMLKVCVAYLEVEMTFGGKMFLQVPSWIGLLILPAGFASILLRFFLRAVDQGVKFSKGPLE
jgi:TRAP-type C4-dicarboxylate transport system permease small subunit